jgi:hypothetical protein
MGLYTALQKVVIKAAVTSLASEGEGFVPVAVEKVWEDRAIKEIGFEGAVYYLAEISKDRNALL